LRKTRKKNLSNDTAETVKKDVAEKTDKDTAANAEKEARNAQKTKEEDLRNAETAKKGPTGREACTKALQMFKGKISQYTPIQN
jgi:hypothetical protein